jgi:hypothetical protein
MCATSLRSHFLSSLVVRCFAFKIDSRHDRRTQSGAGLYGRALDHGRLPVAMLSFTFQMRSRGGALAVVILAAATIATLTGGAFAGTVKVSGTHNEADIEKHCNDAKGVYFSSGSTYGCSSTGGDIKCTSGNCVGSCKSCGPAIAHGKDPIFGVLSGTTLKKLGTDIPTKTTARPVRVKTPVADSSPGATSNNETRRGKKK